MIKLHTRSAYIIIVLFLSFVTYSKPVIYVNQVGFDTKSPKIAIIGVDSKLDEKTTFTVIDASGKTVFTSLVGKAQSVDDWMPGQFYYKADFSSFQKNGNYKVTIN